jgi:myo-inositol-1-phosphate synthase
MLCSSFTVDSPNVTVADGAITSNYTYQTTRVAVAADGSARVTPVEQRYVFKTQTAVPKLGMMLVGWGGNNGSTVTAGILANIHKMSWPTREGTRSDPAVFPPFFPCPRPLQD